MALPLVVGIDGPESSLEAVDLAAARAARHGLSLHLVHAAAGDREPFDVISAGSERAGSRNLRVRLSSEVLHADVAAALVDKRRNAFALVLGSRGLGDLADMLGAALQVSLREAQVRTCPLTAVHTWNPSPRALHPSADSVVVRLGGPSAPAVADARRRTARHDPAVSRRPGVSQGVRVPGAPALLDAASADLLVVGT